MNYRLNQPSYQQGLGVHLTWTLPTTGITFTDVYLYIQRSPTKSNWPLQPYYNKRSGATHVPPADGDWTTIQSYHITNNNIPVEYWDNSVPNPTFNYRLVAYYFPNDNDNYTEYDWNVATISQVERGTAMFVKSMATASFAKCLAVDKLSDGSIVTVGYFLGPTDFTTNGTGVAGVTLLTPDANGSMYVAKYTSNGQLQIVKGFKCPSLNAAKIKINADNQLYVVGYFSGGAGANVGGSDFTGANQSAITPFIVKYDQFINHIYSMKVAVNNLGEITCLDLDSGGNLLGGGYFKSQLQGISITGTDSVTVTNNGHSITDSFFFKMTPAGVVSFVNTFAGNNNSIYGIHADATDRIMIVGYSLTSINFGDGLNSTPSGFLAKFSADGQTLIWKSFKGSASVCRFYCSAKGTDGHLVVSGDFFGSTNLGDGTVNGYANGNTLYTSMFLAKYSQLDGSLIAKYVIVGNGTYGGDPASIAIDSKNEITLVGYMRGSYDFGGKILAMGELYLSYDIFMAKYSAALALIWATYAGGDNSSNGGGDNVPTSVKIDSLDNPIVAGCCHARSPFDGSAASDTSRIHDYNRTVVGNGSVVGFLEKIQR